MLARLWQVDRSPRPPVGARARGRPEGIAHNLIRALELQAQDATRAGNKVDADRLRAQVAALSAKVRAMKQAQEGDDFLVGTSSSYAVRSIGKTDTDDGCDRTCILGALAELGEHIGASHTDMQRVDPECEPGRVGRAMQYVAVQLGRKSAIVDRIGVFGRRFGAIEELLGDGAQTAALVGLGDPEAETSLVRRAVKGSLV